MICHFYFGIVYMYIDRGLRFGIAYVLKGIST